MARKLLFGLTMVALLVACAVPAVAQESAVKGNLGGTVYDSSGAVVPGAKVTITGPIGSKSMESDGQGNFLFQLLTLGSYSVKVEKTGFKVAEVKNVEVFTNRMTSIRVTLEPGAIAETIEVNAPAVTLDPSAAGIGANLHDTFYQQVPVSRNIAGLFYLSAGVASGGRSGAANPSISGGSGLENLYVADGVNITDSAFGGLGVFSRVYGSVGTGINLSFVKEVQVKTGGYEPQYGRSTGGIVQIVTKSGSRDFHGALAGYFSPDRFEAERKHPDDFGRTNLDGKVLHRADYDASAELGGYIPGARERVFWFGAFNPTRASLFNLSPKKFGLSRLGEMNLRTNTLNYAFKGTIKLTDSHQIESSIFGDPSHTSTGANPGRAGALVIDNQTAFSRLEYGTRNWAFRYNGTLSPTWLLNASFTWGFNEFKESKFANLHQIRDRTQTLEGQRGVFTAVGLGFYEPTESNTFGFNVDTSKQYRLGGQHTANLGYRLERPFYDGSRLRSGPSFPIPATNASGLAYGAGRAVGQPANAAFSLRLGAASCTLCPLMTIPGVATPQPVFLRQDRGEFGRPTFETEGTYHAVYGMDSWSLSKYITMNLGLRWEQQEMKGQDIRYTFTGNWSPRVGLIVDPFGNRKTKAYVNFGRYNYAIPLDMAERSLSSELDFIGARWAPDFTTEAGRRVVRLNQFGTVTPVLDAAHVLSRATGGTGGAPFVSFQSTTGIAPGTKMEYLDEFVVGFEREFRGGVIFSARYIDRRIKRIVEDMSGIGPEAAEAGVNQEYLIGNVGSKTDLFTNPVPVIFTGSRVPAVCDPELVNDEVTDTFGNVLGKVCYKPTGVNNQIPGSAIPDGVADGFPDPVRIYQAVEIEVNKAFSRNWQMRANWRIAKLFGNFEGAFRNDNGQTDPSISSLFDFVQGEFGLLGDQFKPGVLNTDRRHIVNFYSSYVLDRGPKGMTLGAGVRVESGIPINRFKAHPAYLNSGEVPVGGRGSLGRTPVSGSVDVHLDYPIKLSERMKLRFGIDLFNIADGRRQLRFDQDEDVSFGVKNVDFLKPIGITTGFQRPFYARAMVRFEF